MYKRLVILILLIAIAVALPFESFAKGGRVRVKGYLKKNGTYVQPHYRTAPDGKGYNNWSSAGNLNPYTGKIATGSSLLRLKSSKIKFPNVGSSTYSSLNLFRSEKKFGKQSLSYSWKMANPNSVKSYINPTSGRLVYGHFRTSPNSFKFDNYSAKGNYNPFTGKKGTVDPFK